MTVEERLEKIESLLAALLNRETAKEWYTTEEVAKLVGKPTGKPRGRPKKKDTS